MRCEDCPCTYESCSCKVEGNNCAYEDEREAQMIELEGKLLGFEENIGNRTHRFSEGCKITIPEIVPVYWGFNRELYMGTAKAERKDDGLYCTVNVGTVPNIQADQLKDIIGDGIGCGGYYNNIKSHKDAHNIMVVDSCALKHISMTLSPVSKDYKLYPKERN